MRFISVCCALLLIAAAANAANNNPDWKICVAMENMASAESELNCYRQFAQETQPTAKPLMITRPHGLFAQWQPVNALLSVYKQNYVLLFARTTQTNTQPSSPNAQNQVLVPAEQDGRDLKFQFSMKHDLVDFERYGGMWFGYTQLSYWQFYDAANSRPFRENNYEPELIYSLRPVDLFSDFRLMPGILNVGLVHQSNGQSNPRSRSWNRVYIQPGIERNYGNSRRLIILVRLWQRIKESAASDDNPDITDYLGYGDVEIRYSLDGKWEATAIARSRSVQLDLAAPWESIRLLMLAAPGEHNTNIHLQYFNGYGESLIDYNHRHTRWGFGMSFPFN